MKAVKSMTVTAVSLICAEKKADSCLAQSGRSRTGVRPAYPRFENRPFRSESSAASHALPDDGVDHESESPPAQLAVLPSAPAIKSQLVPYDYGWWTDNRDAVIAQWNKWILS